MASKYKSKKNNKLLYAIVILIGILLLLVILSRLASKKENITENTEDLTQEEIQQMEQENITSELQSMEERDRMEYYFSMFLEDVENGEYEKAYNMLYSEFKENYFPTLDSFTEYVQKTFPEMANIEHENIERNGDVYVLWIQITDALNGKPGEKKEMNFVIQENDYNDFVMSFSVI